jgi:hypothetical protein
VELSADADEEDEGFDLGPIAEQPARIVNESTKISSVIAAQFFLPFWGLLMKLHSEPCPCRHPISIHIDNTSFFVSCFLLLFNTSGES